MPKSNLKNSVEQAAESFALQIITAIRSATLKELVELQEDGKPKKPGRKRGPKPKVVEQVVEKPARKKRVVKNYPKCAYTGCDNNRFVRGKGFCGDHWKMWLAGKIKAAEEYKK
ncbi:MAG: hypothetical protein GY847_41620 [Proteobacteria bacterium]|nr:hypothetical protein [Pseudomonadota bacterium]